MNWIKAKIYSNDIDMVTLILMDMGINNIEIIDKAETLEYLSTERQSWDYIEESFIENMSDTPAVVFYVQDDENGHNLLKNIKLPITIESVNDESWLNEWKKHFKPINIKNITIVPEWVNYTPKKDEIIFILSHCSAFGTGQHATTRLCIEALQDYIITGDKMLDIGCGSGILSIISLLLGAEHALAIDIDPVSAITATKENARINNISGLTVKAVNILTEPLYEKFDLILANIVSDVIIELASIVPKYLNPEPEGIFISSGIIIERSDEVGDALKNNGFTILEKRELDGWCCFICKI